MSSDLLDIIIYMIILMLYGGGSFLAKKFKKDEDDNPSQNSSQDIEGQEQSIEHEASVEDIKKQIQRKIQERTGQTQTQKQTAQEPETRPTPKPQVPEILGDFFNEIDPEPAFHPEPAQVSIEEPEALKQLKREKLELERKRQEAERLAKQAKAKKVALKEEGEIEDICYDSHGMHVDNRPELLASFRDPHALQNAFFYQEIMGTPVALRKDGEIRQSWKLR